VSERCTIDELVARVRGVLRRVAPEDLAAEMRAGALVIDVRPADQRARDGALPGAVVVDRNVLEWRLDPASPDRIPEVTGYDQRIIVVCNEGYSSSLAVATLLDLGLIRATDLIGGYQAWWVRTQERQPDQELETNSDIVNAAPTGRH
jgi:rhodanese-related sulfurtransferase